MLDISHEQAIECPSRPDRPRSRGRQFHPRYLPHDRYGQGHGAQAPGGPGPGVLCVEPPRMREGHVWPGIRLDLDGPLCVDTKLIASWIVSSRDAGAATDFCQDL